VFPYCAIQFLETYTDPHLIKDTPMCESGPKTCVLSISRVHERKEHVVKLHALILMACKHHVQLFVANLVNMDNT